jgi:Ca-activated chloride channel family protein
MGNFYFDKSFYLILIILALVYAIYSERKIKKREGAIFHPYGDTLKVLGKRNIFIVRVPYLLASFAMLFISISLARPCLKVVRATSSSEGIAIMLTMDVSGSMLAEDFQPTNRIDVARKVLSDFVKERKADRMGLVTFAGLPFLRCPLTTDHNTLLKLINDMKAVRRQELDGTAIGDALVASAQRLNSAVEKSKVIILVTDGENNKGEYDPILAAKIVGERNIKVYAVGIGTKGLVPYPTIDQMGQKSYMFVKIGFNEDVLKKIADETKGRYFSASDKDTLEKVFKEIDQLEKSKVESPVYIVKKELFIYPLAVATILLIFFFVWEFLLGLKLK